MGSGSAGTLNVTVGASTGALEQGMKRGEDVIRRFSRTAQQEADAAARSSSRMIGSIGSGGELAKRSLGAMAGGFAMMAGASDTAASRVGGTLARAFGAFAVGGPTAAGLSLLGDGITAIGRSAEDAAQRAKRFHAALAQAAGVSFDHLQQIWDHNNDLDTRVRAARLGKDPTVAQREQGRAAELESARADVARADTEIDRLERQLLGGVSDRRGMFERLGGALFGGQEISDRSEKMRGQLEAGLSAARLAKEQAQQRLAAIDETTQKEAELESITARNALVAGLQAKAEAQRRQRLADDRAEAAAATAAAMAQEAERVHSLTLRDQLESHLLDVARQQADAVRAQRVEHDRIAAKAAEQAQAAGRAYEAQATALRAMADAAGRMADEQARAEEAAKRTAQADRDAAAAQERASRLSAYGQGFGPNAMRREEARFARRQRKGLRHEANLADEARSSMAYGTVADGALDPFASDLGSVYDRFVRPPKAPQEQLWFRDAISPQPVGMGSGSSSAYDPALQALVDAGHATKGAGDKATEGAAKLSGAAGDIVQGSGDVATALWAAAGHVERIADKTSAILEAANALGDRLTALEQRQLDASLIGG
jgi:hypothetical protein